MLSEESLCNQQINAIIVDQSQFDERFVYYLMTTQRDRLRSMASGSATPILNKTAFSALEVTVPPLPEQRAIAEVLGALDDKIEANRQVADLINELVLAEVEDVQARWISEVTLGDILERVNEVVQPDAMGEDVSYVALEHIPRGSIFLDSWGSAGAVASAKAQFLPEDILFGKLRPYFKKVVTSPCVGVCSTDVLVLRSRQPEYRGLALGVCASDELIAYATAGSDGTRMPRVSWDYLSKWTVKLPSEDDLHGLQSRLDPMLSLGVNLSFESQALAQLRDILLPKLLSGELRVRDVA